MAPGDRNRKIIGEAIRKHRKEAWLTQEKLAEKADLHPVYVGEVERGEQEEKRRPGEDGPRDALTLMLLPLPHGSWIDSHR